MKAIMITASKKKVSKEDKFLSSLIKDDNNSSLNKINLFALRTQVIPNQGVDTVSGLISNKATRRRYKKKKKKRVMMDLKI